MISDYGGSISEALEPLTTKPVVVIENGPGGIDLQLEAELAELPDEEAAAFREGASALEEIAGRLKESLGLITFFTIGPTEARAWTLRGGRTALDAAGEIHTDIARGFIRCEVIEWSDLVDAGTRAEVRKRGLERLEGKDYVVREGDVINIRFNV
jgi:ribosome-binding ATPase YchF (GTP1/OBG family)